MRKRKSKTDEKQKRPRKTRDGKTFHIGSVQILPPEERFRSVLDEKTLNYLETINPEELTRHAVQGVQEALKVYEVVEALGFRADENNPAREFQLIFQSVVQAYEDFTRKIYTRIVPLHEQDPPELWRFALSRLQFKSEHPLLLIWRASLGSTSFAETLLQLARDNLEDELLEDRVSKALKIQQQGIRFAEDYFAGNLEPIDRILTESWIKFSLEGGKPVIEPHAPHFFEGSLCFYSDLALAKTVYFLQHKGTRLPLHMWESEADRVRKRYRRLKLLPARSRLFRDVEYGKHSKETTLGIRPVRFKNREPKASKSGQD